MIRETIPALNGLSCHIIFLLFVLTLFVFFKHTLLNHMHFEKVLLNVRTLTQTIPYHVMFSCIITALFIFISTFPNLTI